VIRLSGVTKTYPRAKQPALEGITVDIPAGQFVFLVGASGSGKTTLLRLLLRAEEPSAGRIEVAARDLAGLSHRRLARARRQIGCVFQDFRLLSDRTVAQNVTFALDVTGRSRRAARTAVPEILELVGLADKGDRYPEQLSGGEQQRAALARAMVARPPLLLADEPTGNLDPATGAGIVHLLERINEAGTTVVMATHNAAHVNALRRRVLELDAGVLVRDHPSGAYSPPSRVPAPAPASVPAPASTPAPALGAWAS